MDYKAKYRAKTKKLNAKKITDYASFREAIKKAFPECPDDFAVGYFDDDMDHLDVDNEDDFEGMAA
jgi:hypothetical protein